MSCWTCTCPDFERRQKVCKHCLFILSRVLKFDVNLVFPDQKVDAGRQQRSIEHRILLLQYRASQDSKDQKETNEIRFEVIGHSGSIYEVLYVAESKQSGYVGSKLQMQQKLQTDKDLTLSITKWNQELAEAKKKEQGVTQRPYVDQECPICLSVKFRKRPRYQKSNRKVVETGGRRMHWSTKTTLKTFIRRLDQVTCWSTGQIIEHLKQI